MPIYDYQCRACGNEFEAVVRTGDTPECPACRSRDLERLLSTFAVTTPEMQKARAARQVRRNADAERKIQVERDREADRHRHEEH